eukprot:Sspe_Gene.59080::Locus_32444_Transcript_1_1_Confidence_1.000_Length_1204::g.59080::m.59080
MMMHRTPLRGMGQAASGIHRFRVVPVHPSRRALRPTSSVAPRQLRCYCTQGDDIFGALDRQLYPAFKSVQTDLVRSTPSEGLVDRVSIIPMQHIASPAFYNSILDVLYRKDRYFLVLIEGIVNSPDDLEAESRLAARLASDEALRQKTLAAVESG